MRVDLVEVPSRGASNLTYDFFERIIGENYVFLGNGEDGSPDRESLEMLTSARWGDDYRIHFAYPLEEIDAVQRKEWNKAQNSERSRQGKSGGVKVRRNWNPEQQSLLSFFDQRPEFMSRVSVISNDQPYLINLLDLFTPQGGKTNRT